MLQQRLGESDKDYEARKKRVKRCRQGIDCGLAHGGGGGGGVSTANTCLPTVGVSGTVIGFDTGLGIGSAKPTHTASGVLLYGFSWDYPAVKGEFFIKWGADGKVQLPDVDQIFIKGVSGHTFVATWDAAAFAYTYTDLAKAQELNTLYDAGTLAPKCFTMLILPTEFIKISYTEMLIGA